MEIGESVVRHRDTVVYSGNAVGKDWLVGGLIPWWLWTRPDALVVVTGPSQSVLGTVTWKEVRKALAGARFPMRYAISQGVKCSPLIVRLPDGRQALGYSTTGVERASGQHSQNVLVIVEEASGVEPEAWEAIDGLKYTRLLAIGNPIRPDGRFVELIRQAEREWREGIVPIAERVNAIRIPSTDSPHARLDHSPWGLADRTWLDSVRRRYGAGSLYERSHVLAEIPEVGSQTLIPSEWLTAATLVARKARDPRSGRKRLAIDLAEGVGADSTVLLVRDDLGILEVQHSASWGLAEAAAQAAQLATRHQISHDQISYDKLGLGSKFPHYLARHGIKSARPYAGEAGPRNTIDYPNLRTEAAFKLRYRLDRDWTPDPRRPDVTQAPFHIPPASWWPRLREELEVLTYELTGTQTRILAKEDWTAELGHSPDLADALIQSFAF